MGRRKVCAEKLRRKEQERRETFSKRCKGLFKKAHELASMCGCHVQLWVEGEDGRLYHLHRLRHPLLPSLHHPMITTTSTSAAAAAAANDASYTISSTTSAYDDSSSSSSSSNNNNNNNSSSISSVANNMLLILGRQQQQQQLSAQAPGSSTRGATPPLKPPTPTTPPQQRLFYNHKTFKMENCPPHYYYYTSAAPLVAQPHSRPCIATSSTSTTTSSTTTTTTTHAICACMSRIDGASTRANVSGQYSTSSLNIIHASGSTSPPAAAAAELAPPKCAACSAATDHEITRPNFYNVEAGGAVSNTYTAYSAAACRCFDCITGRAMLSASDNSSGAGALLLPDPKQEEAPEEQALADQQEAQEEEEDQDEEEEEDQYCCNNMEQQEASLPPPEPPPVAHDLQRSADRDDGLVAARSAAAAAAAAAHAAALGTSTVNINHYMWGGRGGRAAMAAHASQQLFYGSVPLMSHYPPAPTSGLLQLQATQLIRPPLPLPLSLPPHMINVELAETITSASDDVDHEQYSGITMMCVDGPTSCDSTSSPAHHHLDDVKLFQHAQHQYGHHMMLQQHEMQNYMSCSSSCTGTSACDHFSPSSSDPHAAAAGAMPSGASNDGHQFVKLGEPVGPTTFDPFYVHSLDAERFYLPSDNWESLGSHSFFLL